MKHRFFEKLTIVPVIFSLLSLSLAPAFAPVALAQAVDNYVWTLDYQTDKAYRIDKSTNTVTATIGVGNRPSGVAVDTDSVWVANFGSGTVSRIKKSDKTVITIPLGAHHPGGIAVDADSVWVADYTPDFSNLGTTVTRINKSTNTVIAAYTVGAGPQGVAVDTDSVWVAVQENSRVSRINKTNETVVNIPLTFKPFAIAVDADFVWVTSADPPGVFAKIRKSDNAVIATINVGGFYSMGVAVDTDSVWIGNRNPSGSVLRINKSDNAIIATIPVENYPSPISVDADSVWVVNEGSGTVSRISKATKTVIATVPSRSGGSGWGDMTGFAYDMFFGGPPPVDTDGDGLFDAQEATLGTDPNKADTDGDGLTDGAEVNTHKTNPLLADTDADGFSDGAEITAGTDPLKNTSRPFVATLACTIRQMLDLNGDDSVTIEDAVFVLRAILGLPNKLGTVKSCSPAAILVGP